MRNEMSGTALAPALWPASVNPVVRNVLLVVVGAGILTLSAKISVPFWPVNMTLQTFAVMLIGAAYGRNLAVATVVAYLAAGFAGLPVFTTTPPIMAGPTYFLGTTGGFLLGFIPAAFIVGWAADRGWDRSLLRIAAAMIVADAVVFALGFTWLAFFATLPIDAASTFNLFGLSVDYAREVPAAVGSGIGAASAWTFGVANFLLADAVKIGLAAAAVVAGWRLVDGRRANG
jgi:biotin transport system substrate-specific component